MAAVEMSLGRRVLAFIIASLIVMLAAAICTGGRPLALIVGEDNRYSSSKFQLALWFGASMTAYLATMWLRVEAGGPSFLHGIKVPENILILSGVSALTTGAAKAVTAGKIAAGDDKTRATEPAWSNLVTNDRGSADIGDFQMLLVSVLAVAVFLADGFFQTANVTLTATAQLPNIDTGLLAAFGISQAAYLGKKGASKADGS